MHLRIARDALVAHTVVERHVVVVVAEVDGPVARDAQGYGIVLILRLLDVVREQDDFPLRWRVAVVEIPSAEGDVLGVVRAGRFVVSDVLPALSQRPPFL